MHLPRLSYPLFVVLVLLATVPTVETAHAGDAQIALDAPASASGTATNGTPTVGLQEVVVTATRREEDISKVPISLTLTQAALDSLGVQDFQDMARYTPGVSIDPTGTAVWNSFIADSK